MSEYGDVNFILGKALPLLPETKSPKPVRHLLHTAPRVLFLGSGTGRMVSLSTKAL
jgi:hypothetical protein